MPAGPDAHGSVEVDGPYDVARSIPRMGTVSEPTWRHRGEHVEVSGRTPEGPVAFRARSGSGRLVVEA